MELSPKHRDTFTERMLSPEKDVQNPALSRSRAFTDLTVVVALKNDQLFLQDHVRSILDQEGIQLQILFADAGSTDGTVEQIEQLIRHDDRCELQMIQAKNIADLRNQMLPHVRSPYVWFIDGCNPIPRDSCAFLFQKCHRHDADVVAFSTTVGRWGPAQLPSFECDDNQPLTTNDKVRWFSQVYGCFSPPTARVYKTSFLRMHDDLVFVTDNAFDGFLHNWYSTILADRVLILPKYFYHQNESTKLSPWRILGWQYHADVIAVYQLVRSFLHQNPERTRFLKPLEEAAISSYQGHLYDLAQGLDQMRRQLNQEIEDTKQIVSLPILSNTSDSEYHDSGEKDSFQEALAFYQQGDLSRAALSCRQALSRNPAHADSWHLWSILAQADQDSLAALGRIRRAIFLCDTNPVYFNHYGTILQSLERYQEAKEIFEQVLSWNPDDLDAWLNLGQAMLALKQDQRYIEKVFRKAISLAPQHSEVHYFLAINLFLQEKNKESLVHFEQALTYCTTKSGYFYAYAVALKKEGRFEESLSSLETAIHLDPNAQEAWWQLALLRYQLERPLEHVDHALTQLLRLQPGHGEAITLLMEVRQKQSRSKEIINLVSTIDVVCQPTAYHV